MLSISSLEVFEDPSSLATVLDRTAEACHARSFEEAVGV